MTSITSKALENVFLSEIETEIPFSLGGNDYVLNITGSHLSNPVHSLKKIITILHFLSYFIQNFTFSDMYQQNKRYKTKRAVQRRPRFISAQDIKGKSARYSLVISSSFEAFHFHIACHTAQQFMQNGFHYSNKYR